MGVAEFIDKFYQDKAARENRTEDVFARVRAALEDHAKSLGISLEELRERLDNQVQEKPEEPEPEPNHWDWVAHHYNPSGKWK